MSPIGVVSALGVVGARVAGVIACLFAERREMRRGVSLRDGLPVSISSSDVEVAASSDMGLGSLNDSDSVDHCALRSHNRAQISALRSETTVSSSTEPVRREAVRSFKRSRPENPTPGMPSCQLTVFHETADSDFSMGWEIRIS